MKTSPATTMLVFAIYLVSVAVMFLIMPNALLTLFGLPETNEVWIRALGMVVLFIAIYYYQISRENLLSLMQTSVYIRASVVIFLAAFVLLGYAKVNIMLFAGADLLGAAWTWYAMRNSLIKQAA